MDEHLGPYNTINEYRKYSKAAGALRENLSFLPVSTHWIYLCEIKYIRLTSVFSTVYGYGSACVFVLCLASLSGVLLLPLMRRNARHYVIAGFQGLAFSTLASDALLHLLPEVIIFPFLLKKLLCLTYICMKSYYFSHMYKIFWSNEIYP